MDDVPAQSNAKGSRTASVVVIAIATATSLLAWSTSHSLGHLTAAVCFLACGPAMWYQPLALREDIRTAFTRPPPHVPIWARLLGAAGQVGLIATLAISVFK